MIRGVRGALLALSGLALIMLGGPALADCQPSVPASGQTVTCTGLDTVGVDGSAATQVTVNVLSGATVNPAAAGVSIALGGLSVVNNAGAIVNANAGTGQPTGIEVFGSGSTIVNSGSIVATGDGSGVNAFAISLSADGNTVTNSGTIAGLGLGPDEGRGIVGDNDNVITNTGLIRATSGDCCGIGIAVVENNVITNTGTITGIATGIGQGVGIEAFDGNRIINDGTISGMASDIGQAFGVSLGDANTVINNGTIAATAADGFAFGVFNQFTISDGNTITNNGTIRASVTGSGQAVGLGVFALHTIVNNGTIEAVAATPDGFTTGVSLFALNVLTNSATGRIVANSAGGIAVSVGPENTVINQGTILANGVNGIAIEFDDVNNTLINQGLIQAVGAAGAALFSCACASDTVVVNSGTIDGRVDLSTGSNNVLTNTGLLTISPAGAAATHAITGTFTQGPGGTLALRVDDVMSTSDRLAVVGTANLGGTLRAVVQPGLYVNTQTYAGVITGGIAGTFATVVSTSPFLSASAAYFAGQVDLTLTRIPFNAVPGLTDNQRAVATGLEAAYSPAATGNAATIYGALFASESPAALDSLSGEIGTGGQNPSFAMGDAFFGALGGQAQRWRAGGMGQGAQSAGYRVQLASAQPSFELASFELAQAPTAGTAWPPRSLGPRWAAWASGFGLSGSRDGDGTVGSARLGYTMGGGAFGADVEIAPNLLLGAAVAAAASDFSLDGRASSGDVRTVFFGLYGSWTTGPLYVDAALGYGHGQFSTTRTITLGSTSELANGSFEGNQYGGRLEAGWRFMVQRYALTPFAALAVQALHQNGYNETTTDVATGAQGILGLSYDGETTTSVRSFVGAQASTTFAAGERLRVTPRLRLAWAHEFNADRQVGASFLSIPGAAFTVSGARPPRDSAIVGAGIDVALGHNVALFAQFDGDLSGEGNAYAGSGGIRISW